MSCLTMSLKTSLYLAFMVERHSVSLCRRPQRSIHRIDRKAM